MIESHACSTGLLHPLVSGELQPFFPSFGLSGVRISIKSADWLFFRLSGRGRSTPCFVVGRTVYFAEGVLNGKAMSVVGKWGTHFDLATPAGWATLAHECFHVQQNVDGGWLRMIGAYVGGVVRSLGSGRLWDHQRIPYEQEAIAFEDRVFKSFASRSRGWFTVWGDRR